MHGTFIKELLINVYKVIFMNSDQNIRDMGLQPLNQVIKNNNWSNHEL